MAILKDLADHLISVGAVPAGRVFLYSEPTFQELTDSTINIIYSLNISSGISNPKWTRDTHFINFRVRGRNKSFLAEAEQATENLYHELLGSNRLQIGNSVYSQFNSSEAPRLAGFYEGSEPVFTFTLMITTESLVDTGNRLSF